MLDITQRYHPDFVISHLFGRSPSLSIKAFKDNGYPLSHVVGLVWASGEADIKAAGGWDVAQGYNTMQFAGAGDDYPVRQAIKAMYQKEGKAPPADMENTVYYNRGLFNAAIEVQALSNALKLTGGKQPTGDRCEEGLWNRSTTSHWAVWFRRCRSRPPIMKAAAGCGSSRSRAKGSSR